MFKMHDVLIPGRFFCFILQLLLTISAAFGYKDFVNVVAEKGEEDYNKLVTRYFLLLGFFLFCECCEFIILITGYTLFIDLLSLAQIFFHSIAVLILNWFYRDVWKSDLIYIPFILGGVIPIIFEMYNFIILCQSNRIITKIN